MKAPGKYDVFQNYNFLLKEEYKVINGNFFINGTADAERFYYVLEVNGDLIIKDTLYIGNVIVHGDLICDRIVSGLNIEVDGDVYVSSTIRAKSIKCKSGDILFDKARIDEKLI